MKQSLQRLEQDNKQLHEEVTGAPEPCKKLFGFISSRYIAVLTLLLGALVPGKALAQQMVSGKVTSTTGEELPGVTIVVKGTSVGTITDISGNFKVEVPGEDAILVFSYVGYKPQELVVGKQSSIKVTLEEDIASLDEVVVVGYGTQKKSEITSSIVEIKSENFMIGKIQDATDLVKGKIPGLVLTKSSGDPNATSNIMLRGINSLGGSNTPLILIDGIAGDMTSVSPESIESISVLKDASSAAIYGTRGASGVILITTKGGLREKPAQVNYTGYATLSDFYKEAKFMGPDDIRQGKTSFSDDGYDTDWLRAVTQTGYTQKHVVTMQGGTKNTTYSALAAYKYEQGTMRKTNNNELKVQLNLDHYFLNDKVKVGMKLWKTIHTNTANNASVDGLTNVYRQAVIHNPTSPIYNDDGSYYEEYNRYQYYNPVELQNELKGTDESERTYMVGTLTVEPVKNWKTNLMVSDNLYNTNYSSYTTSEYYTSYTTGYSGSAYKSYDNAKSRALEFNTGYDFDTQNHSFKAIAGYSYYYNVYEGFSAGNSDFPTDSYLYNNIGQGSLLNDGLASMSSYKNDNTLVSFFGRVNYGFMDKYNLSASLRHEGSSKFGENHKWGNFPAVSAAWTISNEGFMRSTSWVNNLKLRAGYGVTGRIASDSYNSLVLYGYDNNYGNFVDSDGNWVSGLQVTQNANPNLKWETSREVSLGIDFTLFRSRITGSVDV